jgi:MFS family permease
MPDSRYAVVLGACLTQFMVIGLLFSYGLFFRPLEEAFGWSRTLLSTASALSVLVMGLGAIPAGRLNDRYGPRRVLAVSGVLYGIGYTLLARVNAPWQLFVLLGTLIGIGLSTHDVVTLSTVARWFEHKRGIMTGVVKTGTALGQVTVPLVAAFLLERLGFRPALVVLGTAAAALLLIAALLMRHPPALATAGTVPARAGLSFAEARRGRVFWTLCAVQFTFFPALMTVPLHIAVHGMDLGLSAPRAAVLLSVIGASSIAGRLTVGGLVDRIGGRTALVLCFALLAASLSALTLTKTPGPLYGVVAVYGFAHGGFFTVVSPTVATYFGMRAHGAIFGTVLFSGTVGGSIAPILAGYAYDVSGSYQIAFAGLVGLSLTGLMLVLTLPRPGLLAAAPG